MKDQLKLALLVILLCALSPSEIEAQIVEIESRTDGFLPPVMTTSERNAIVSPRNGLIIYNEDVGRLNYFEAGIGWVELYKGSTIDYFMSLPDGIQILLDSGETPGNILNAGASTEDFIGLNYQGGIIFYMESNGTGLVAATEDQSMGAEWGCFGTDLPGVPNITINPPSGPGAEIGDGSTNTSTILSLENCPTAPAALACDNYMGGGHNDWFLPSIKELDEMYKKIGPGAAGANNNIGNFEAWFYWSSSEFSGDNTWVQNFVNGSQPVGQKNNGYRVRAIRAF